MVSIPHGVVYALYISRASDGGEYFTTTREEAAQTLEYLIDVTGEAGQCWVDHRGQTPLHLAAAQGHAWVVALLLARGADAGAVDSRGRTPLAHAVGFRREECAELLEKATIQ